MYHVPNIMARIFVCWNIRNTATNNSEMYTSSQMLEMILPEKKLEMYILLEGLMICYFAL